jgi:hypothetical protein
MLAMLPLVLKLLSSLPESVSAAGARAGADDVRGSAIHGRGEHSVEKRFGSLPSDTVCRWAAVSSVTPDGNE